jgi:hypothetical protein
MVGQLADPGCHMAFAKQITGRGFRPVASQADRSTWLRTKRQSLEETDFLIGKAQHEMNKPYVAVFNDSNCTLTELNPLSTHLVCGWRM